MKISSTVIGLLSGTLFFMADVVHAGVPDTDALSAIEATDTILSSSLPVGAVYYSASLPDGPPMPGSMGYDAWQINSNTFLLDDVDSGGFSMRGGMRAMDDSGPPGFGDGGGGGDYTGSYVSYTFDTNGLWLQITNVSNWLAYVNLMNATNAGGVYEIFSKTNLLEPAWDIEAELWPSDTN